MNPSLRRLLGSLLLTAGLTLTLVGQTDAPTAPPPVPAADKAEPAPSATPPAAPEVPTAPVAPSKADADTPAAADVSVADPAPAASVPTESDAAAAAEAAPPSTTTSEPALRRLDTESSSEVEETEPAASEDKPAKEKRRHRRHADRGGPRVMILSDVHVGPGEAAEVAVAVGGSATNEGDVHGPVVAIGGDARSTGKVGEVVVAILGNAYVDGEAQEVVAVMGTVELGPKAVIRGQLVSVGGTVKRHPDAMVGGEVVHVGLPLISHNAEWLQAYVRKCILMARPLAIGPHLAWAWFIAFGFLAAYAMLALLFHRAVRRTQETLETRPGGSFLAAILTILLTPVLTVLLAFTLVGVAAVPFIALALIVAKFFGKVVVLAWLGSRLTRLLTQGRPLNAALDVLVGGLIVLGLYCIPVIGFLTYKLLGMLGLGVAVYTVILATRKPKPAAAPKVAYAPASGSPVSTPPTAGFSAAGGVPAMSAGFAATAGTVPVDETGAAVPPLGGVPGTAVPPTMPPPVAPTALPRAGFWIRTGALALDVVLVAVLMGVSSSVLPSFLHMQPPSLLLALAVYGAIFWKLKGTTIGGIICGLRVVRTDGRELDWSTAVVRALGCFLSLIVVGLGFIWVAIDDEKQSWHDKIAGTTVVLSRGNGGLV